MSEYFSFPPIQPDDMNAEWGEKWFADAPRVAPPITSSMPEIFSRQSSKQPALRSDQMPFPIQAQTNAKREGERPPLHTGPIYDIATTQSLLTALQGTMSQTGGRQPVVIHGAKRRGRVRSGRASQARLHPRLRFAIVIAAILIVILTTLISLNPLGSGQNGSPFFNDVVEWAQAQQQGWDITAHINVTNPGQMTNPGVAMNPGQNQAPIALPQSQYVAIARQDAVDAGINPDYFVRQIFAESGFNPQAASGAGAVGIAQFIPGTAASLGINPYDPVSALRGAATLMASYSRQYNGDYAKALAAYNAGGGTVDYAVRMGGANWMNYLPFETRSYITKVIGI
jgi:Transglycosylase SLT domain